MFLSSDCLRFSSTKRIVREITVLTSIWVYAGFCILPSAVSMISMLGKGRIKCILGHL